MKRICIIFLAIFLFGIASIKAQNTDGTDFWLTFGKNTLSHTNCTDLDLQIRIVNRDLANYVTIRFTELGTSISQNLAPREVWTYPLNAQQIEAVYNTSQGRTPKSVHITSNHSVTAYAINQTYVSTDATNLLPVTALEKEYYQISYIPRELVNSNCDGYSGPCYDAYAVIATENNTQVWHNGGAPVATLSAGQVYYQTSATDMTSAHITADKPVAFFSLNDGVVINGSSGDCFMQQLAPVNTWGKNFFVPVSDLTVPPDYTDTKNRVRIMASQNNTIVTPSAGATLITDSGGQTDLSNPLQAGQFFELEITLNNNGCYIQADKPVGVCAYFTSRDDNNWQFSDPSEAWVPSVEQTATEALIAPFIVNGMTALTAHNALIIAPTTAKNNTLVSIGGAPSTNLSDGVWRDNTDVGWSFYNMPLTDETASYYFTNPQGIIIMGYGTGNAESYYYLAYSAMRNLSAAFYANDIYYLELPSKLFCEPEVDFRAEINFDPKSLKWYIDGVEEVAAQNQLKWNKTFAPGKYEIRMWGQLAEDDTISLSSTLNIGATISTSASPPEGGTVTGDGCYKVGNMVNLVAIPEIAYRFVEWREDDIPISSNSSYSFIAEEDRILTANFEETLCRVTVEVNPKEYGSATGSGLYGAFTQVQVEALANSCYRFKEWTIDDEVVSTANPYEFTITGDVTIVANFYALDFDLYSPTLWNNTFMLDLKRLREEGYEVIGCKWYKNGVEETDTRTINEFSYSAGPEIFDLLESDPTYYMFRLITKNYGELCSTLKIIDYDDSSPNYGMWAHPNPVRAGVPFAVKGVAKDDEIRIYNQYGVCVHSAIADRETIILTLNVETGVYVVRANGKRVKVVIIK